MSSPTSNIDREASKELLNAQNEAQDLAGTSKDDQGWYAIERGTPEVAARAATAMLTAAHVLRQRLDRVSQCLKAYEDALKRARQGQH